jgi:hypothetical protein
VTFPSLSATGPASAADRRALFAGARARWPKRLPAGWKVTARAEGGRLVLLAETGMKERSATFFPLEFDQIDNVAPQAVTPSARGVQLVLQRADPGAKPPGELKGVLVLGPARAFEVAVPVTATR